MCSDAEIGQLISRVTTTELSNPSLDLIQNLGVIHKLISEKRKIDFEYGKYDLQKQIIYYHKKRDILPVRVIYFHERFYLRCYNLETSNWRTYRVDRMKDISGSEAVQIALSKEEKPQGFVADMFEPEYYETVTLRVKKYLLDDMLEHFDGFARLLQEPNKKYVRLSVKVGINQQFFLWIMKYGDQIEVVEPADIRKRFLQEAANMIGIYPEIKLRKKRVGK